MAYEPREPSTASNVANVTAQTAKGVGLGVLTAATVLIGAPLLAFAFSNALVGIGVLVLSGLLAGPVLFGAAGITGGIFGARHGLRQNNHERAKSRDYAEGKALLAAQEAQLTKAQDNLAQATTVMPYIMTPSQVRECPNCHVANMNYQGPIVSSNLQQGLAG